VLNITERYTRKWFELLVAAMIQPVMLFAFLWMFLSLIDSTVASIFDLLGGNDFQAYWRNNTPLFSWSLLTDPTLLQKYEARGAQPGIPIVQSFMGPLMGRSMDLNIFHLPGIDFGPANMLAIQQLIAAFIAVLIVIMLLRTMLDAIPRLADDVAGVTTRIGFENIPFVGNLKQAVGSLTAPAGGGG